MKVLIFYALCLKTPIHAEFGVFWGRKWGKLALYVFSLDTNLDLLEQEIVSGSGISWAYANLHLAPYSKLQPITLTLIL